jgi:hypothetical protein
MRADRIIGEFCSVRGRFDHLASSERIAEGEVTCLSRSVNTGAEFVYDMHTVFLGGKREQHR